MGKFCYLHLTRIYYDIGRMNKLLITLVFLLASSTICSGKIITVTCDFYTCATPEGIKKAEDGFKGMRFVFNSDETTGVMLGNAGESKVLIVHGEDSITFIQVDPWVTSTTIELNSLKVVHSRNTVLVGDIIPSQYYGKAVNYSEN